MSKKKNRVSRLPEDAKQQLLESVESLIFDSQAYDLGNFKIIKRSSATLRMLFYDSYTSHSLINQVGDKNLLKMYSFVKYPVTDELFYGKLYCARFWSRPPSIGHYDTFLFQPHLEKPIEIDFDSWWNGTVFKLGENSNFTRGKIITTLANQDGGAHFDPTVDSKYKSLTEGTTGFQLSPKDNNHIILGGSSAFNNQPVHFKDIHLAIMREITHETILSLKKHLALSVNYSPNFDYNWERKLNPVGFHFSLSRND